MSTQGKVAIVESNLSDGSTITAIEVVIGRQRITISDQATPITDDVRELALNLITKVRELTNDNRS